MADAYYFMIFGVLIATGGFLLALRSRSGRGQTTFKVMGMEFSLSAAGGVMVIFLGIITFAMPTLVGLTGAGSHSPQPATEGASQHGQASNAAESQSAGPPSTSSNDGQGEHRHENQSRHQELPQAQHEIIISNVTSTNSSGSSITAGYIGNVNQKPND